MRAEISRLPDLPVSTVKAISHLHFTFPCHSFASISTQVIKYREALLRAVEDTLTLTGTTVVVRNTRLQLRADHVLTEILYNDLTSSLHHDRLCLTKHDTGVETFVHFFSRVLVRFGMFATRVDGRFGAFL